MGSGARRSRAERDSTVGSRGAASSAQSTRQVAGPGSSSVLSSAFWASRFRRCAGADDGDAEPALHGRQRQVGGQLLDLADADLLAGALGRDDVQVGVVVGGDLATGGAVTAGTGDGILGQAQQSRREIERQRGLAHATWAHQEQGVGRAARCGPPGRRRARPRRGPGSGRCRRA